MRRAVALELVALGSSEARVALACARSNALALSGAAVLAKRNLARLTSPTGKADAARVEANTVVGAVVGAHVQRAVISALCCGAYAGTILALANSRAILWASKGLTSLSREPRKASALSVDALSSTIAAASAA